MSTLIERYDDRIAGCLDCLDRVMIAGTLPSVCHAQGMTQFLYSKNIRIFDYTSFVEPLRDAIRDNAERMAAKHGLDIEFVAKKHIRKEELAQKMLAKRGDHPGLVCILSAMESCTAFKPWHDNRTHETFLKTTTGKCLHYYFYFIDEQFGLCHLRVPTWSPFRLQFYFNGHSWLAKQLDRKGIGYDLHDNAFVDIDDWNKAQRLADAFNVKKLHRTLDRYTQQFRPVLSLLA